MKRQSARYKHHKTKPTPPGIFYSPLVQGLLNLIPIILVISLFGLSINSFLVGDFKSAALVLGSPDPTKLTSLSIKAAQANDYTLAQTLYTEAQNNRLGQVLGVNTSLERLIFPERAIRREIDTLIALAQLQPSRLVYLRLVLLYWRLAQLPQAKHYLELAQNIDPNDESIARLNTLLNY